VDLPRLLRLSGKQRGEEAQCHHEEDSKTDHRISFPTRTEFRRRTAEMPVPSRFSPGMSRSRDPRIGLVSV
jgi:hypothetical protein